jgi:phage terminase large subunit-like protein
MLQLSPIEATDDNALDAALIELLCAEIKRRTGENTILSLYPETGPLRRELYAKHMEFFRVGAHYPERAAICANRVGKTLGMGGYETALHLTGRYPDWWDGRRFMEPIEAWAAGKTNETTRDIIQLCLIGKAIQEGSRKSVSGLGLIPKEYLGVPTWKAGGVPNLVDTIPVKHTSGGWSSLGLKCYEQGRGAFEGTAKHVIWLDEEPDEGVYDECLIRTATTHGIMICTFTPLEGMSKVVLQFLPQDQRPT